MPSEILDNNSPGRVQRGNILVWEQPLADRLKGVKGLGMYTAVQPAAMAAPALDTRNNKGEL